MKKLISTVLVCAMLLGIALAVFVTAADGKAASLPPVMISGFTYSLDELDGLNAYVNGVKTTGSFVAQGSTVSIEYKASDDASAELSYSIPVVDTENGANHAAYFYCKDKTVGVREDAEYITLSYSQEGAVTFANVLNSNSFSLNMELAGDSASLSNIVLTLTDEKNSGVSLTMTLDPDAQELTVGTETVPFSVSGGLVIFKYNNLSRSLIDASTEEVIYTFTQDDRADEFHGFSAGAYMTLGFENVTGSCEANLKRLCNQPLGHRNSYVVDQIEPSIALLGSLHTTQIIGDVLSVPDFCAYDVFSQISLLTLSVSLPDGTEYYSGDYAGYTPVAIDQSGKYRVTYHAEDSFGNAANLSRNVSVSDNVAPTLTVSEMPSTQFAKGDSVTFPDYTASDNQDAYTVDVILVLPNCELFLLLHDENGEKEYYTNNKELYRASFGLSDTSFCAEQTGTYVLRYVAYDESYNRTVVEVPFTVN